MRINSDSPVVVSEVINIKIKDALKAYEDRLSLEVEKGRLREQTRDTYTRCIKTMLDYLERRGEGDVKALRGDVLRQYLQEKGLIRDYRQLIKYVCAIRQMENKVLGIKKALLYGETEKAIFEEARKYKKITYSAAGSGLTGDEIERKINALRNKKLKLAFRMGLRTGLRVSEISKLEKDDISFNDNTITVDVKDGKGGKQRTVCSLEDEYLVRTLKDHVNNADGDKLFYSESHMKNKAGKLGFQMHDLRRCYSRTHLNNLIESGMNRTEAKEAVKQSLGHNKTRTTDIYLRKARKGSVVNE